MDCTEFKARVDKFLMELTEHVPGASIQVLAAWNEDGFTKSINAGTGNWYARQGLAHEFINSEIAEENARLLAEQIKNKDESD